MMSKPNVEEAKKWMDKAIQRHERHMMGDEPTTGKKGEISQMLMMEEMTMARRCLTMGEPMMSGWYEENSEKMDMNG